jgi:hypothetical protein
LRRTHTAALRLDEAPAAAKPPRGASTRDARAPAASRYGRSLVLHVRHQEVQAAFAVQLPATDPALVALRAGRIALPAFVDDVFAAPRFNRKPISSFFAGVRPRLAGAGTAVTLTAASEYQRLRLEELPAFAGDVEIANALTGPRVRVPGGGAGDRPADGRRWSRDVLSLRVEDYRVVERDPAPLRVDGTTYMWEHPFVGPRGRVAVSLAYTPLASVDALRSGLNLSVFAFVPHVVARFLTFFHGFVLAAPMFAYLVLSRRRNPRFAAVARRLIVLAVAADVFDACISAQPDVDGEIRELFPALRALAPSLINVFVVPAVIGLVLALVAACVAKLAEHVATPAASLLAEGANAVRLAALAFVAAAAAGYAAGGLVRVPFLYPALAGAALAAVLLAALVAVDWWTIPRPGRRRAFTTATVAFAVVVAVPLSLVQYGVWATLPEHAGTAFADPLSPLPLTAEFLRSLAALCPLAFGLLVIAGVRPEPAALGLDAAGFARLVFCCYAALPGVVVLVPVGLILAWCTFPWLLARGAAARARSGRFGTTARERGLAALPLALAFAVVEALLLVPSETQFLRAGGSVLRKACNAGIWAVACSLPAWFLRSDGLLSAVAVVLATAVFYVALGRFFEAQAVRKRGAGLGDAPGTANVPG